MSTLHQHRLLAVVPAAKVATVVAYCRANLSGGQNCFPDEFGPSLSATGSAPATHAWASTALIDADARLLLFKLCQLASVAPPSLATWNGWTGAEKRTWLLTVRAAILSGWGVYLQLSQGDGAWDDPQAALTAMGLQRITAGVP